MDPFAAGAASADGAGASCFAAGMGPGRPVLSTGRRIGCFAHRLVHLALAAVNYQFYQGLTTVQGPLFRRISRIPERAAASLEVVCSPLMRLMRS